MLVQIVSELYYRPIADLGTRVYYNVSLYSRFNPLYSSKMLERLE